MSDFGLPREQFAQQREILADLPDDRPFDLALHDVVAPAYVVEDKNAAHPLAGLPEECIRQAIDLMDARALGFTAYWGSMSAEETARRTK